MFIRLIIFSFTAYTFSDISLNLIGVMADIISKIPDKLFSLQVKLYRERSYLFHCGYQRNVKLSRQCSQDLFKGAFLNINLFSFQTETYLYNTRSS